MINLNFEANRTTYWDLPSKSAVWGISTASEPAKESLNLAPSPEEGHSAPIQSPQKSDEMGIGNVDQAIKADQAIKKEDEMTVARILATKGREVLTAQPHRTLMEVAEILAARGVGAVVIADVQGSVLGILSEREIVRAVSQRGAKALEDAASMHMTTQVVTTTEDETVFAMAEKMNAGRFRHIPVLKGGRLAGIVSIGDVVKFRLAEMEYEQSALREYIAAI
jgi:CBS domain-containing protein